jgi:hypothetical protein
VPLLGTVIEQNGDGCLEDSLRPVLHLDGAVKQKLHRTTTSSELDELLQAYDMKRNLVELNYEAAQASEHTVLDLCVLHIEDIQLQQLFLRY